MRKFPAHPLAFLTVPALIAGLVAACATNPATGRRQLSIIGSSREVGMGRDADKEIVASMGLYPDPAIQEYVRQLGKKLAALSERPDLTWSFKVVDDPVVNAFALPGGFIYVTRGILAHFESEAQLAAVLGHEIGHVTARHSVNQMTKSTLANLGLGVGMILAPDLKDYSGVIGSGLGLLFLKYSRDDESQADDLGLRYLERAGYDPREMVAVFTMLERVQESSGQERIPNWLATHPAPENRAARISGRIRPAGAGGRNAVVGKESYLARLDGMVFGADPRKGFFENNVFYHPELQFRLEFPEGWTTRNDPEAVSARSPREDAIVRLGMSGKSTPAAAAEAFFGQTSVERGSPWTDSIHGLPAVSAGFLARTDSGEFRGLAAFVLSGGKVYQLLGYTRPDRWSGYVATFQRALSSYDRVTDPKILGVQPNRVRMVRLDRPQTLEQFQRLHPSNVSLAVLALINHVKPGQSIPGGESLKRVTGGRLP